METIRIYSNGKVYNTKGAYYTSMRELAEFLRKGVEVKFENPDETDGRPTERGIMLSIINNSEKQSLYTADTSMPNKIIRSKMTMTEYARSLEQGGRPWR